MSLYFIGTHCPVFKHWPYKFSTGLEGTSAHCSKSTCVLTVMGGAGTAREKVLFPGDKLHLWLKGREWVHWSSWHQEGEGEKQRYFYECSSHFGWLVITDDDDNYNLLRFIVHKSKWLSLFSVWLTGVGYALWWWRSLPWFWVSDLWNDFSVRFLCYVGT